MQRRESLGGFLRAFVRHFVFSVLALSALAHADPPKTKTEAPKKKTDLEHVGNLIGAGETIPDLFAGAAAQGTNLLELAKDSEDIQQLLESPDYRKLVEGKKSLGMLTVRAQTSEKITVWRVPAAELDAWKKDLGTFLETLRADQPAETQLLDRLRTLPNHDSGAFLMALLRAVPNLSGPDRGKLLKAPLDEQMEFLAQRLPEDVVATGFRPAAFGLAADAKRTAILAAYADVHSQSRERERIGQLWMLLSGQDGHIHDKVSEARARLNRVTEDSLDRFLRDEPLQKGIDQLLAAAQLPADRASGTKAILKTALPRGAKEIADKREEIRQTIKGEIKLVEVPPELAVLRGCAGADCASRRHSFAYALSPREHVFFVYGQDKLKGYVAITEVDTPDGKALYLHTINGKRLNASDVELILKGVQQKRAELGATHILLPEAANLSNNVNYEVIRQVIAAATKDAKQLSMTYLDTEYRELLAKKKGWNNNYDAPANNTHGRILATDAPVENYVVTKAEAPKMTIPTRTVGKADALLFALDLYSVGSRSTALRLLDEASIGVSGKDFRVLVSRLDNEKHLPLSAYLADAEKALVDAGIPVDKTFLEKRLHYFELGYLACPDARDPAAFAGWHESHRNRLIDFVLDAVEAGEAHEVRRLLEGNREAILSSAKLHSRIQNLDPTNADDSAVFAQYLAVGAKGPAVVAHYEKQLKAFSGPISSERIAVALALWRADPTHALATAEIVADIENRQGLVDERGREYLLRELGQEATLPAPFLAALEQALDPTKLMEGDSGPVFRQLEIVRLLQRHAAQGAPVEKIKPVLDAAATRWKAMTWWGEKSMLAHRLLPLQYDREMADYLEAHGKTLEHRGADVTVTLLKSGHPSPWARTFLYDRLGEILRSGTFSDWNYSWLRPLVEHDHANPKLFALLMASLLRSPLGFTTSADLVKQIAGRPEMQTPFGLYLAKLLALDAFTVEGKLAGLHLIAQAYPNTPEIRRYLEAFADHPIEAVRSAAAEALASLSRKPGGSEPPLPSEAERRAFAKQFGGAVPPADLQAKIALGFSDSLRRALRDSRGNSFSFGQIFSLTGPYLHSDPQLVPEILWELSRLDVFLQRAYREGLRQLLASYVPPNEAAFEELFRLAERNDFAAQVAHGILQRTLPNTDRSLKRLRAIERRNKGFFIEDEARATIAAMQERPKMEQPYSMRKDFCRPVYRALRHREQAVRPLLGFAAAMSVPLGAMGYTMYQDHLAGAARQEYYDAVDEMRVFTRGQGVFINRPWERDEEREFTIKLAREVKTKNFPPVSRDERALDIDIARFAPRAAGTSPIERLPRERVQIHAENVDEAVKLTVQVLEERAKR